MGATLRGGESAYYLNINRNKRSMTLNLGAARGRGILGELIQASDVVIDNFKLGTLGRWRFDDDWYAEHAPAAIRCSISGHGRSGPRAGQLGYDFIAQAESGLMAITGEPDGGAMKLGVAIVDFCVGLFATISILAAIEARHTTGRGQYTEVNLHDTGLQMLAAIASNHLISGEPAQRYGNGHPNIVPYRTFTASDGDVAIGVGNDVQFRALCEILDHPEWATDLRFARNEDRVRHRQELEGLIAERVAEPTTADWIEVLSAAGIQSGHVSSVAEALSSPHAIAREMVALIDHPTIGSLPIAGIADPTLRQPDIDTPASAAAGRAHPKGADRTRLRRGYDRRASRRRHRVNQPHNQIRHGHSSWSKSHQSGDRRRWPPTPARLGCSAAVFSAAQPITPSRW